MAQGNVYESEISIENAVSIICGDYTIDVIAANFLDEFKEPVEADLCDAEAIMDLHCLNKPQCDLTANTQIFGNGCTDRAKSFEYVYHCSPAEAVIESNDARAFYCDGERMEIHCGHHQKVKILEDSYYGRRVGAEVCPTADGSIYSTDCEWPGTLALLAKHCPGKSCMVNILDQLLDMEDYVDPCPETFKYLMVHYECVHAGP